MPERPFPYLPAHFPICPPGYFEATAMPSNSLTGKSTLAPKMHGTVANRRTAARFRGSIVMAERNRINQMKPAATRLRSNSKTMSILLNEHRFEMLDLVHQIRQAHCSSRDNSFLAGEMLDELADAVSDHIDS